MAGLHYLLQEFCWIQPERALTSPKGRQNSIDENLKWTNVNSTSFAEVFAFHLHHQEIEIKSINTLCYEPKCIKNEKREVI